MLLVDGKWARSPLVKTDRTMHAAGGMGTTARDAARWLILNTNRGELDGRRILPEALAREYYAQQSTHPSSGSIRIEEGFALGWNVGKYRERSRPYFFHGVTPVTSTSGLPNRASASRAGEHDGGGGRRRSSRSRPRPALGVETDPSPATRTRPAAPRTPALAPAYAKTAGGLSHAGTARTHRSRAVQVLVETAADGPATFPPAVSTGKVSPPASLGMTQRAVSSAARWWP
jgi:hypothetical protein